MSTELIRTEITLSVFTDSDTEESQEFYPKPPEDFYLDILGRVPIQFEGKSGIYLGAEKKADMVIAGLVFKGGWVDDEIVARWAYSRRMYGDHYGHNYPNIFLAAKFCIEDKYGENPPEFEDIKREAEIYKIAVSKEVPDARHPLYTRLKWTANRPLFREDIATDRRIESTDLVRGKLIPAYDRRGIDILNQIRLVHHAHMNKNEHVLLSPQQAGRVLTFGDIDRLGGVIRSNENLATNIGLAGMLTMCANYEQTPDLMKTLAKKAEELFPLRDMNPKVTEDSIYYFVSAFQLALALIHPFYEANGRTSEDLMYILWQRRPDLAHTIRYVSANGQREGQLVEERGQIINSQARMILRNIATMHLQVSHDESKKIKQYKDLVRILSKRGLSKEEIDQEYTRPYGEAIKYLILGINMPEVQEKPVFEKLVDNLRRSSTTYTLSDGRVIGPPNF